MRSFDSWQASFIERDNSEDKVKIDLRLRPPPRLHIRVSRCALAGEPCRRPPCPMSSTDACFLCSWKALEDDASVQPTLVRMPKNKYPIVATALPWFQHRLRRRRGGHICSARVDWFRTWWIGPARTLPIDTAIGVGSQAAIFWGYLYCMDQLYANFTYISNNTINPASTFS